MSFVTCPVSTALDLSIGGCMHMFFPVPPGVPPVPPFPMGSFEMVTFMAWPFGLAMGTTKLAYKVKHGYSWIVMDGHDCGPMICDITMTPTNALYPLQFPFSSRKSAFAASTVNVGGSPTACMVCVILPMMTCGEPISMPTATTFTNMNNTVMVGMTLLDILGGVAGIVLSVVIDKILAGPVPIPSGPMSKAFLGKIIPRGDDLKGAVVKAGLSAAAGFVISGIRCAVTKGEYPVTLGASLGSPFANIGVGVAINKDGVKVEESFGAGPVQYKPSYTSPATGAAAYASPVSLSGVPLNP